MKKAIIIASIEFESDSKKLSDDGDWDSAQKIVEKLYEIEKKDGGSFYWGEGTFSY